LCLTNLFIYKSDEVILDYTLCREFVGKLEFQQQSLSSEGVVINTCLFNICGSEHHAL
jgi:hypothetical protein